MGLINFMADKIRQKMWHFLQVNPASKSLLIIDENMDYLTSCAKNRIWYAGKSKQLSQLYGQLDVPNTMFWKSPMTSGMEIRKIHIPLASLIVDTIAKIVMSDYNGVEITSKSSTSYAETWADIEKDSKLVKLLSDAYESVTGEKAELYSTGGGTYARMLGGHGVAFGPAFKNDDVRMHNADESMDKENFFKHAQICLEAMYRMFTDGE